MRRPDYTMFVRRDRTAGFRDRAPGWQVVMQLPEKVYALSDAMDQDEARRVLAKMQSEAGKLLYENLKHQIDTGRFTFRHSLGLVR
jgi:hypothetical protein